MNSAMGIDFGSRENEIINGNLGIVFDDTPSLPYDLHATSQNMK